MPDVVARPRPRADVTAVMVRWPLWWTLIAAPVAAGSGWLLAGRTWGAAASGTAGALLAGAVLVTGAMAVRWLLQQERTLVMPGAAMIAIAQFALLFAVVLVVRQQSWWEDAGMAFGALVAVVAVQVAMVLAYVRSPRPYLEVDR